MFVDTLAVPADAAELQRRFLALRPAGSDAHLSYFDRIRSGPAHGVADALRPTMAA